MIEEAKLAELRSALEEQRETLRKEIVEHGGNPESDEVEIDVERNFADSAHSTAERARVVSLMKALRSTLKVVDAALSKMELGTYGVCERCGRPIPIERLEALPWVTLCIECKQRGEGR